MLSFESYSKKMLTFELVLSAVNIESTLTTFNDFQ